MATYNSTSLPFHPYTMKANQVYALIAVPSSIQAGGPLTFSNTYGGTYNPLSDLSYVNGGFLKSSTDVLVTVTKKSFKQLTDPIQSYKSLIYRDKPSYYWSLDEVSGLVAVDSIGNANGTISGGVTLNQSGAVGKGMLFDGVDDKIASTQSVRLVPPCSVEFWFKLTASTASTFISTYFTAPYTDDVLTFNLVSGKIQIRILYAGASLQTTVNTQLAGFNDGNWHHVAYILTGGTSIIIYVDGVNQTLSPATLAYPFIGTTGKAIEFGTTNWLANFFNGTIDEVAIYPYALTLQQIQSHYFAKSVPPNSYASAIIASKPTNYWQLDEEGGLVANDIVGGAHGTISGGVTLGQVGIGKSYLFNGTTGKIVAPSQTLGPPLTLEAWFKSSTNSEQNILGVYQSGTNRLGYGPQDASSINYAIPFSDNTTTYHQVSTAGLLSNLLNNQWHHIATVFSGGTSIKTYIDGTAIPSQSPLAKSLAATTGQIEISEFGRVFGNPFNGSLDEVAIYNRALSASEILAHYNARPAAATLTYAEQTVALGASNYWKLDETSGLSAVDSIGGKNGTISGGVTLNQTGAVNKSMLFDGTTGKIITAATHVLPATVTIEGWIKTTSSAQKAMFSTRAGAAAVTVMFIGINTGKMFIYDGAGEVGVTNINNGQWHHVVYVHSGSNWTYYLDGVLDKVSTSGLTTPDARLIHIGYDPTTTFWVGEIDEVAIYPRALTAGEILSHYQARNQ